jgi:hypothetical protein
MKTADLLLQIASGPPWGCGNLPWPFVVSVPASNRACFGKIQVEFNSKFNCRNHKFSPMVTSPVSDFEMEKRVAEFVERKGGCALLPQLEQLYTDFSPEEKNLALEVAIRGPAGRVFLWGFRQQLHDAILRMSTRGDAWFGIVNLKEAQGLVKSMLQGRNYQRFPLVTQFSQLKEEKERWLLVAICLSEKEAKRRFNNVGRYTSYDPDTGLATWKWEHPRSCPRCSSAEPK